MGGMFLGKRTRSHGRLRLGNVREIMKCDFIHSEWMVSLDNSS